MKKTYLLVIIFLVVSLCATKTNAQQHYKAGTNIPARAGEQPPNFRPEKTAGRTVIEEGIDAAVDSGKFYSIKCFYDSLGTGIYDSMTSSLLSALFKVEVGKNGIVIDTITITSGMFLTPTGLVGDIYSYKLVGCPLGLSLSSPFSGIIYDTVKSISKYHEKYFGFNCSSTSGSDLQVFTSFRAGIHYFGGTIFFNNASCNAIPATLTMRLSPRYNSLLKFYPAPTSIVGELVSWNFTLFDGIKSGNFKQISVGVEKAIGFKPKFGDTLITSYTASPVSGDINPGDNVVIRIDTVKAGYDPNDVAVNPSGFIPSSATRLTYTIHFENTGNDTAFHIKVFDTLSPNINLKTLKPVMASHAMNISILEGGYEGVVVFDFPKINLLDSSHHNECQGMVIFTVDTKGGLPNGTTVDNRAGIYFDYNDVVMTNTARNTVGIPTSIESVNKIANPQLYPNPAENILTIRAETSAFSNITITNTVGQVMLTQAINANQTQLNVKDLAAGIYYVSIRGEGGAKVLRFEKL